MSARALSQNTGPFAVGVSGLTAARTYTFRAYATNALGTGYSATATFDTLNTPPTANAGGPYTATEGSSLTLSGSGTDANGDALTYSWDVNGDGTYGDATGASPTLNRAARDALGINDGPATFNVRVRVSDGKDTTTSAATSLSVPNAVPDATVTNGGPVNEGSTGTVSFTNVTDGSAADTAAGFRYAYDFNNDGTYEVGGTDLRRRRRGELGDRARVVPRRRPRHTHGRDARPRQGRRRTRVHDHDHDQQRRPDRHARQRRTVDEGRAAATFGARRNVADPGDLATGSATPTTSTATAPTTPPRRRTPTPRRRRRRTSRRT